jgi:hypothetical protein
MFATTSTRCASVVTAGSCATANSASRRRRGRDRGAAGGARRELQRAGVAVEHHARAGLEVEDARVDPRDRGDAQPAREDRDVRGGAPHRGAEAAHARAVQRRGVRRREVLGRDDRVRRDLRRAAVPPDEQVEHAAPHVAHVGRAPREQLALERREPVRLGDVRLAPREGRRRPPADRRGGGVEHLGVLQQLLVRGEDGGLVGVRFGREPRLERLELQVGRRHRGVERAALVVGVGRALVGHLVVVPHQVEPPHRHPRRGGHAAQRAVGGRQRPRRRRGHGRGRSVRGRGGRGVRAREQLLHRRDRGRRVGAARDHRHRVASAHLERHDRDHAPQVGLARVLVQPQVGGEATRRGRQLRRRARVQPRLARHDDRTRLDRRAVRRRRAGLHGGAAQRDVQQRVAPRDHPSRRLPAQAGDAVHVRHEHHREQAPRVRRHVVRVEREQRVAAAHHVAGLRDRREARALEQDGVEADVDQDVEPRRRQGEGVAGAVHLQDAGVARREHAVAQRIDRDPVAGEPLRERGVGDEVERDHHARERRGEDERALRRHRGGHGRSPASRVGRRSCSVVSLRATTIKWPPSRWRSGLMRRACPSIATPVAAGSTAANRPPPTPRSSTP